MQNKTFRLFISSTFNDFHKEREVLQTKVFPYIKEYASKVGYTFQPIDLRWGVSNEAQLDQKTLELCLSEVRACKTSEYPNFLIMVGDRYGWIPLPYLIEENEFDTLVSYMSKKDSKSIQDWYKLDLNQLPASYILKERTGSFEEYINWIKIEDSLRGILQSSAKKSSLSKEQTEKYFFSATEAEVMEGIFPYGNLTNFQKKILFQNNTLEKNDHKHIFGFFRDIDISSKQKDRFIVDDYEKAQKFKISVKQQLDKENILQVSTRQIDIDKLEESYLKEFESKLIEFLISQVDEQKAKEIEDKLTPLEVELKAQSYFAQQKRKDFIAQEDILKKIDLYIKSSNPEAFVIYGKSGIGKSSIIAQAIDNAHSSSKKIIYRFIGATPSSGSSVEMLTSILKELDLAINTTLKNVDETKETFEKFSYRVYNEFINIKDNVVIFIDAVDQLGNEDQFIWLPNNLPKNIKIIISALDDNNHKESSKYFQTLKEKVTINNLLQISEFSKPKQLLYTLLKSENRTLQKEQEEYFLKQFTTANSPLYISVAIEELKHWKSYDYIEGSQAKENGIEQDLQPEQHGIIKEFIDNLSDFYHHNKEFVKKVFGFIYASRDGLSESELLELISTDKEFIEKIASQEFHKNHNTELPLVNWSRLHIQLKPFLSLKTQDDEELIYFFHREFEDVIREFPSQKLEHENILRATQVLILKSKNKKFTANRWGKLHIILLTEYGLRFHQDNKDNEYIKFITLIKNRDWLIDYLDGMRDIGYDLFLHNQMKKAIVFQESCLYISEVLYKKDAYNWKRIYTESLNNLALTYQNQNNLDDSIKLQKENLKLVEKLYTVEEDTWNKDYFLAVNNLALSYQKRNSFKDAIALQKINLKLTKEKYDLDPDVWDVYYALALNNLSISYQKQNRIDEAIDLQKINLTLVEVLYEDKPLYWAEYYSMALNNLSLFYSYQNLLDKALIYQHKNVDMTEKLFKNNPNRWVELFLKSLINLGLLYYNQNKFEKAIFVQEKSLKISTEFYLDDPHRWIETYTLSLNNLALSYSDSNRLDEAVILQEKNLHMIETYYADNPSPWAEPYILALNNMAMSYFDSEKFKEAITIRIKTLDVTQLLYDDNPDRWVLDQFRALNNLADSYIKDNQELNALELKNNTLEILEVIITNHKLYRGNYIGNLTDTALLYSKIDRVEEAITNQVKNIKYIDELRKLEKDTWDYEYARALYDIAPFYVQNNQLNKAIECLKESQIMMKSLYQADSSNLALYSLVLDRLTEYFSDDNQFQNALELRKIDLGLMEIAIENNEDWGEVNYIKNLTDTALLYSKLERVEEAITSQEKNIKYIDELRKLEIDTWDYDYARALYDIAPFYVQNNQLNKSIKCLKEAQILMESLYKIDSTNFGLYSMVIDRLAEYFSDDDQFQNALKLRKKDLELIQMAIKNNLEWGVTDYINNLTDTALLYSKLDKAEEAIIIQEKNIKYIDELRKLEIDTWDYDYARVLYDIAPFYVQNNQLNKAIECLKESQIMIKSLYQADSENLGLYSIVLDRLAEYFSDDSQFQNALEVRKKDLELIQIAIKNNEDWGEKYYIENLTDTALLYAKLDRVEEATKIKEKIHRITSIT